MAIGSAVKVLGFKLQGKMLSLFHTCDKRNHILSLKGQQTISYHSGEVLHRSYCHNHHHHHKHMTKAHIGRCCMKMYHLHNFFVLKSVSNHKLILISHALNPYTTRAAKETETIFGTLCSPVRRYLRILLFLLFKVSIDQ